MPRIKRNNATRRNKAQRELVKDVCFILLGVGIAVFMSQSGLIDAVVGILGGDIAAAFFAGIFFTSAFTIAPAAVALAHVAQTSHVSIHIIAVWGALGAVCGDLLLFYFIRDRFSEDLTKSFKPSFAKHLLGSFHFGFLKWLSPVMGALIIASPLPDEFGLALLGFSKTKVAFLIPVSFAMNMIGIYTLIWFAHVI